MLNILGTILLILLTMVAYSSGITLASRRREFMPSAWDLLLVLMLWIVVFWLRPQFGHWAMLAITVLLGVLIGYIFALIRFRRRGDVKIIPKSELPEHAREKAEKARISNPFIRAWLRWSDFAARMGNVQGRLLMGFFYFIVVTPFGLVYRFFGDPLAIKSTPDSSNWIPKEALEITIEAAREQG